MRRSTPLFLSISLLLGLAPMWAASNKTYSDSVHGIALTYPSDLTMVTDQNTLSQVVSGAADMMNLKGDLKEEVRQVGMQFMLLKKPTKAGDFTSNINLVVESTHGHGKFDLALLVKANIQALQSTGRFKFTEQPTRLTVTGHPCEMLAYQLDINGQKVPGRQYYFYRTDKEEAYDFTVTGSDPEVTALLPRNLKVSY